MIYEASKFVFYAPAEISRARKVLIKPNAGYPLPHPITTSRETLEAVIAGIRRAGDADILLIEGSSPQHSSREIFRTLGYQFPRVTVLDVRDCFYVEIENPLPKPFALPTVWVPNVLLSCDYLISVSTYKIFGSNGSFSLKNLIGLLPPSKYGGDGTAARYNLRRLGIQNVVADLYFTIPFDLGIVDARQKFVSVDGPTQGTIEDFGMIFIGEPYAVDVEASQAAGIETEYLRLIAEGREQLALQEDLLP